MPRKASRTAKRAPVSEIASDSINYEVVIALAGPVGADLQWVSDELKTQLTIAGYGDAVEIRLSALLQVILDRVRLGDATGRPIKLAGTPEDERLDSHMEAGNALRRNTRDGAALATLAVQQIRSHRLAAGEGVTRKRAYIVRSLKHADEVNLLRRVYGAGFFLVSVSTPKQERIDKLALAIARSHRETASSPRFADRLAAAKRLIAKDEIEPDPYGQQLRAAFQLGDVFLSVSERDQEHAAASAALKRFVELLLGNTAHTPLIDEMMMFHAYAASLRSAALGRQVGAILATDRGEILGSGCNDVPSAAGGLYWSGDHYDGRDITRDRDSTNERADQNVTELLDLLRRAGWLSTTAGTADDARNLLKSSRIMNLLEFGRTTHAEMEAISSAARVGTSVHRRHLYSTTFPCHECARLIVTSGIARVVFIEPYPKSLAVDLHDDAISLEAVEPCHECGEAHRIAFVPFEGIGPRRFIDLFSITTTAGNKIERKDDRGFRRRWNADSAVPRLQLIPISYLDLETKILREFNSKIESIESIRPGA